ncbi:holo-ACP synthase [Jeotgalibacillus soli]|uniref:Holo-[acyl-carrier-protein] synthase n=1 Tax=Jeotgalibacillus soli TaxID=889306 RepID=A0A0C2W6J4_9BACL|nr:holo-ACP synthase [Jeotgalibacillus soli]KIL52201.1 4'-phosphopantetheinyl transferase [Jeotgalibacillus soli]
MILGIGIDLVELDRIQTLADRHPRFVSRILTENELKQYEPLQGLRKTEFLAGRFAAKEAYAKAAGTGIGAALSFQDIEIVKDELGKPSIQVDRPGMVHVSITHSREYAAAQVMIESTSS